jgi:hypothetical protein
MSQRIIRKWGIEIIVQKILDLELLEKSKEVWLSRIFCRVSFKIRNGWMDPQIAILDTGAPLSLIPFRIWRDISVSFLGKSKIGGLFKKVDDGLEVTVGEIRCLIFFERGRGREYNINAYLAPHNKVPLIIGLDVLLNIMGIDHAENG